MLDFTGLNNQKILIQSSVVNKLFTYIQKTSEKPESGGLFIGKSFTGNILQIEDITYPINSDIQSKFYFFRSSRHGKLIEDIWEQSGHIKTLIGTWHTHPEDNPTPSSIDIKDWEKIISNNRKLNINFIFAIVGIKITVFWQNNNGKFIRIGEINNECYN